ncbi:MAG: hypothetical protein C4K60_06535 [Ideonella sp. MAG2]|nr:MAG: hypothetical protein C4K60_20425 [Ideonella sp. MAG2]TDM09006.1 MAG: hypothetical protein C4K60_06535 [Ideonella sp. MAG2]
MRYIAVFSTLLAMASQANANEPGLDGFQFTAGLGVVSTGNKESIVSSTVDNGTLRITERQKIQNGLWLASHMFTDSCESIDQSTKKCLVHKKSRLGAFVAAQIGGQQEAESPSSTPISSFEECVASQAYINQALSAGVMLVS